MKTGPEGVAGGPQEATRARRALRLLAVAFLLLGAVYARGIPPGKGADESAHLRYILWLAEEHRLPIFDPGKPGPDYEFHQPPLYYLLVLPAYLLAGGDLEAAQQSVRFLTLLLCLPLIYLTFALGRALLPDDAGTALAAAAVVAFLPMHLSVAASIGNDALSETLAAAAVLAVVRYLRASAGEAAGAAGQAPGGGRMAWAGAMIGLAMLAKSSAVLLFPVAWLAAALAGAGGEGYRWRQLVRDLAVSTVVALGLCGWWLVRNQLLYGDPLAQGAFLEAFRGRRPSPQGFMGRYHVSLPEYVRTVLMWTLASSLGVFGPVQGNRFLFFPYWVYLGAGGVAMLAAIGFSRYLARSPLARWQRQGWWICGLLGVLLIASFVRFNLFFFQAQARYLFPALAPAALAFCLGVREVAPGRWGRAVLLCGVLGLAALALFGLLVWIIPQFQSP